MHSNLEVFIRHTLYFGEHEVQDIITEIRTFLEEREIEMFEDTT